MGNEALDTHHRTGGRQQSKLVDRQLICCTPGHEKPQWDYYDTRKGCSIHSIEKQKLIPKLHGSITSGH